MSETMNQVRDRLAEEFRQTNTLVGDINWFIKQSYAAGFDAAIKEVLARVAEFDEARAQEYAERLGYIARTNPVGAHATGIMLGARYQHAEIFRRLGLG